MTSKIYIKRATNDEKQEFEVELDKNISEYKDKICEIFDASSIKIIHRGKILEQDKNFESQGIKNEDTLVIVPTKKHIPVQTTQTPATPAPASVPAPTRTVVPTPAQTSPATIATIPTSQSNIWTSNTVPSDSVSGIHLYNVEEFHAALLLMIPTIVANQETVQSIRENPNNVFTLLNNESTRNIVRQSLKSSPTIVQSLKMGLPVSISLQTYQVPAQSANTLNTQQQSQPQLLPNGRTLENNNAILQMFNNLLAGNYINPNLYNYDGGAEMSETEDDDEGDGEDENNTQTQTQTPIPTQSQTQVPHQTQSQSQTVLSSIDLNNIQQVKEFTGASDEDAKIAYLACYKNVYAAVNKILSGS